MRQYAYQALGRAHTIFRACGHVQHVAWAALLTFSAAALAVAPVAVADASDSLRAAVLATRGTSCAPLRSNPIVGETAEQVNQSNDRWIDQTARAQPVPDALPVLKDLGYDGSKATIVYGAGVNQADAIKALLLQGYQKIPDCEYTDYGVSTLNNQSKNIVIMTLVLAA